MKTVRAVLLLLFAIGMVLYLIARPWTPLWVDVSVIVLAIVIAAFERIRASKRK